MALLEVGPVSARGEKEKAALLTSPPSIPPPSADMTISLLAAYGIPCFKYYDKEGGAGKVINGFSGYGAEPVCPRLPAGGGQGLWTPSRCRTRSSLMAFK